jgi:hypothetical protein
MLLLVLTVGAATAAISQASFEIRGFVPPRCHSGEVTVSATGDAQSQTSSCTVSAVTRTTVAEGGTELVRVTFTPR